MPTTAMAIWLFGQNYFQDFIPEKCEQCIMYVYKLLLKPSQK